MISLIKNIGSLVNIREENILLRGKALAEIKSIPNAFVLIEDGVIGSYGNMDELNDIVPNLPENIVDAKGKFVMPTWCDSHTHLVFAGSRENEFVDKLNGLTYAEIAANGGGILNSAKKINEISEDQLFIESWKRLNEVVQTGTGAIEIKSGYGLSVAGELKMLRVIKKLKENSSVNIKSTFLGAHTFPLAFKENHEAYIHQIINEMLPVIAQEKLADYIDVFCESGFYSPEEMEKVVNAGKAVGLKPKLHVNQLNSIGGIQSAINLNALSVDHLETMTSNDIDLLSKSNTIGTLLPTAAYFLRMPFQPARQLIENNCAITLASDFNPGSSPSGNMNFVVSISCIQMKMLPEEAINSATVNGAFAMNLEDELGAVSVGKKANFIFANPMPSLAYMPYAFGSNHIDNVMIKGEFIK